MRRDVPLGVRESELRKLPVLMVEMRPRLLDDHLQAALDVVRAAVPGDGGIQVLHQAEESLMLFVDARNAHAQVLCHDASSEAAVASEKYRSERSGRCARPAVLSSRTTLPLMRT